MLYLTLIPFPATSKMQTSAVGSVYFYMADPISMTSTIKMMGSVSPVAVVPEEATTFQR